MVTGSGAPVAAVPVGVVAAGGSVGVERGGRPAADGGHAELSDAEGAAAAASRA